MSSTIPPARLVAINFDEHTIDIFSSIKHYHSYDGDEIESFIHDFIIISNFILRTDKDFLI